jgi:kumamolisin
VFKGQQLVGGGTSQSAPIWAGLTALMNEYLLANGGRLIGDLNPQLYRIAEGAPLPAFRDVTLGGNAVANAGPGYDLVTGLGTPDVDNLARNLLVLQQAAQ